MIWKKRNRRWKGARAISIRVTWQVIRFWPFMFLAIHHCWKRAFSMQLSHWTGDSDTFQWRLKKQSEMWTSSSSIHMDSYWDPQLGVYKIKKRPSQVLDALGYTLRVTDEEFMCDSRLVMNANDSFSCSIRTQQHRLRRTRNTRGSLGPKDPSIGSYCKLLLKTVRPTKNLHIHHMIPFVMMG